MSDQYTPDDPWSEVLGQVESALDEAGVVPRAERTALLDGVRTALDALVGVDTQPEAGPDVVVVEGGRRPEDPPTEGSAPTLRVAEVSAAPDGSDRDQGGGRDWLGRDFDLDWEDDWVPEGGRSRRVIVQVPGGVARGRSGLGDEGVFALEAGDPSHTLFLGPEPRAYRIACRTGSGRLGVDGGVSISLVEGCSVDVEARQITFTATGEAGAAGRYVRLGRGAE